MFATLQCLVFLSLPVSGPSGGAQGPNPPAASSADDAQTQNEDPANPLSADDVDTNEEQPSGVSDSSPANIQNSPAQTELPDEGADFTPAANARVKANADPDANDAAPKENAASDATKPAASTTATADDDAKKDAQADAPRGPDNATVNEDAPLSPWANAAISGGVAGTAGTAITVTAASALMAAAIASRSFITTENAYTFWQVAAVSSALWLAALFVAPLVAVGAVVGLTYTTTKTGITTAWVGGMSVAFAVVGGILGYVAGYPLAMIVNVIVMQGAFRLGLIDGNVPYGLVAITTAPVGAAVFSSIGAAGAAAIAGGVTIVTVGLLASATDEQAAATSME